MEEAKKEKRKEEIKRVRIHCKELKIAAGHLKGALAKRRKAIAD